MGQSLSGILRAFPSWAAVLAAQLAVTAGYYVSGALGLLMAVPPGYATAVWPASGLALAALLLGGPRLAAGVALGSFLLNLPTGLAATAPGLALLIALAVAAGAALQALVGMRLVRRYVGLGNLLEQDSKVIPLLLLGGPVACLVSPTVGVSALWLTDRLPGSSVIFNWWTWWAGDVIGVLVFAPLALIWAVQPFGRWLRQQLTVTVPLLAMFSLMVALFVFISRREQVRIEAEFTQQSTRVATELRQAIDLGLNVLDSIEGLYASSEGVQPHEFEIFVRRLLKQLPGVEAFSWNQRVPHAARAAFERAATRGEWGGIAIVERDAAGALVPAATAEEYVPTLFRVSRQQEPAGLGFNVRADPARRRAMEMARDSGRAIATGAVRLVQPPDAAGFLVFKPIYRHGIQPAALAERRAYLEGYVAAVFHTQELVRLALSEAGEFTGTLQVYDSTAGADALMFSTGRAADADGFRRVLPLSVGGREWRVDLSWSAQTLLAQRSWSAWLVLAGGLVLTGMLGILLVTGVGRTGRVEALVAQRTHELAEANAKLSEHGAALARSNRELEQFAYVASHDLKAPLRTIGSFAQLLDQRYKPALGPDGREFLTFIGDGVRHMQGLIEDLLKLAQLDHRQLELRPMDAKKAVDRALKHLAADVSASGAQVEAGPLPRIRGDCGMLAQLFQNLIANSIKFTPPYRKPSITIQAHAEDAGWHFVVGDNGIGIDQSQLERVFSVFRRAHGSEQYQGNGIGLAICKKVVGLHGGEIWARSEPGQWTAIHFTLPAMEAA